MLNALEKIVWIFTGRLPKAPLAVCASCGLATFAPSPRCKHEHGSYAWIFGCQPFHALAKSSFPSPLSPSHISSTT